MKERSVTVLISFSDNEGELKSSGFEAHLQISLTEHLYFIKFCIFYKGDSHEQSILKIASHGLLSF